MKNAQKQQLSKSVPKFVISNIGKNITNIINKNNHSN
jgi:hypothetical protein